MHRRTPLLGTPEDPTGPDRRPTSRPVAYIDPRPPSVAAQAIASKPLDLAAKNARKTFLTLTLLLLFMVPVTSVSLADSKLESTIFSYDGTDFVRTETTLKQDGESAADTKLDQESAAYKALAEKRSYTGSVTVFGQDYQAYYAPLIGDDGAMTGAIFIGVPK